MINFGGLFPIVLVDSQEDREEESIYLIYLAVA
jgi:hypothetical protein